MRHQMLIAAGNNGNLHDGPWIIVPILIVIALGHPDLRDQRSAQAPLRQAHSVARPAGLVSAFPHPLVRTAAPARRRAAALPHCCVAAPLLERLIGRPRGIERFLTSAASNPKSAVAAMATPWPPITRRR